MSRASMLPLPNFEVASFRHAKMIVNHFKNTHFHNLQLSLSVYLAVAAVEPTSRIQKRRQDCLKF
jgi:hypothetical protein